MRRSWIVEKHSDGYQRWYRAAPVEGGGLLEERMSRSFLRNRVPYFVAYEGNNVPDSLCVCASDRRRWSLTRLVHVYSWADAPWIELIAWGF